MALTVLYPGSFDPITNGHTDLVVRASKICDHVILAVARDTTKKHLFNLEERVSLATDALADLPNVEVRPFEGLTAEYARQIGAKAILRGLRAVSDFEFEFQLASMNRNLAPDIETLFLTPAEHTSYVSSTLVREVARLGGDVTHFVAPHVVTALKTRYNVE